MDSNLLPDIPLELLEALEKRIPIPRANPYMTQREIDFESGKRETVDFLRAQFELQQENILINRHVIKED